MFSARRFRITLCLALLGGFGSSAQALQLGETKEQLIAKHGQPGAEDHARHLAVYFWEGWSAQIEFGGNVVRKLTYRRNYYLQDAEITSLLNSNGGATHWRETSVSNGLARQWARDDGASATCGRVRPTSIVFQAAALTAAYQQGPQVVAPGTPNPTASNPAAPSTATPGLVRSNSVAGGSLSNRTPAYPRQLAAVPEPDLPVADSPAPTASPASATGLTSSKVANPLPRLAAAAVEGAANEGQQWQRATGKGAGAAAESVARRDEAVSENGSSSVAAATSAELPAQPARFETSGSILLPCLLGLLALVATVVGYGFYLWKRRAGRGTPRRASFRVVDSTRPSLAAGSDFSSVRKDQVEILAGEIFRREGYAVELSAALNTDDSIDLMLRRDSETTLVQGKHWQAARVTEREVREFYGAMAAGGAPHGILVTTGAFTPDAEEFAEGKGIELLDGMALSARLGTVAKPGENLCVVSSWIDKFIAHARIFDPECPVCQTTMVIRHNRATGTPSWSCRSYPRCPGRREPRLDLLPAATH